MHLHVINKPIGQTPLEALEKFRKVKKLSTSAKLTYAGRLDPMASGVLLILEGATQIQREKYLALPKVYQAQILFGLATDSFDLLGMPKQGSPLPLGEGLGVKLKKIIKTFQGKTLLPLPIYSSVIYKGQPLHYWARNQKKIRLPQRAMTINSIKLIGRLPNGKVGKQITANTLLNYIQKQIPKVKGDFRQEQILKAWKKLLAPDKQKYLLLTLLISCQSGTYIRSLANELGKKLKTSSVLFSLNRLRVGKYPIKSN
jgi:tRNA pseudouridine55 synthase